MLLRQEMRHVYQLGCTAKLLNVHSQQHRAFNLVWALRESGALTPGTRVAVVGAGIAGLAAAVASAACGGIVHLYESKNIALHSKHHLFVFQNKQPISCGTIT